MVEWFILSDKFAVISFFVPMLLLQVDLSIKGYVRDFDFGTVNTYYQGLHVKL